MPRQDIAPQRITLAGLAPVFTAPTDAGSGGGWSIPNTGDQVIEVRNTGGSARTVTVLTPATIAGLAIADPQIVVPATTGHVRIGPFDPTFFNNADGRVYIEADSIAGLSAAAVTF